MKYLEDGQKTLLIIYSQQIPKKPKKNCDYENVERKEYDEDEKLTLYEVYKQTIVPKSF